MADCSVQYLSSLYCSVLACSVCIVRIGIYYVCNRAMNMTAVLICTTLQ